MSTSRLIIEVSASRVEVALVAPGQRGATAESKCIRFSRAEWPSPFTTSLADVQSSLVKLIGELGVARPHATVIYHTPGTVSQVTSCSTSISSNSAVQAATLALASIADFPIDDCPIDTLTLASDSAVRHQPAPATTAETPAPAKSEQAAAGTGRQHHVLASADAEQRVLAMSETFHSAGIQVDRFIPAECVSIADAVRGATQDSLDGCVTGVVWVGEHSTTLAVGERGRLLLVRSIATGTESFVETLVRPLRSRDPEAAPITLEYQAARTLLLAAGIPAADAALPGYSTLVGAAMLPHLQPVLQRLSIEIKQSLRFGVAESDRSRVRIRLAGPGAAVPGLAEAIARLSGFVLESEEIDPSADALDSSSGGLIAGLSRSPKLNISLLPSQLRHQRLINRTRKSLFAGAVCAALLVAYDGVDAFLHLRAERAHLADMNSRAASIQAELATRQLVFDSRVQLTNVEHRLAQKMDQFVEWPAVLSLLSQVTPPSLRLQSLDMNKDPKTAKLSIRGYTRLADTPDPATLIHAYVDRLSKSPIIDNVRLGSTQRSNISGHDSQTFDLTLQIVQMPYITPVSTKSTLASGPSEGK